MSKVSYYVFGAHSRAQTTRIYLKTLYPEWKFLGYLYANDEKNPSSVDGEVVLFLPDKPALDCNARVYIGTRGVYHGQIREMLEKFGFKDIVPVDMGLDMELRNKFIPEYFRKRCRKFVKLDAPQGTVLADAFRTNENRPLWRRLLYVVRSAVDAPLMEDVPLRSFEAFIQAGRAIADRDIDDCGHFDNTGDNISERNRQMCELTAMYWIWKNSDYDIVGLEHYRRRFILPGDWSNAFSDDGVDVILPVPLYVHPSLWANYCNRHVESILDTMLATLKEIHPECAEDAKNFFENTGCYSPCNMLIARKNVFDELCEWLFPVLFSVMDKHGILDDNYQNRYPGFMSERLISFYFFYREKELNVVYADKTFLG